MDARRHGVNWEDARDAYTFTRRASERLRWTFGSAAATACSLGSRGDIESIAFDGAAQLEPVPVELDGDHGCAGPRRGCRARGTRRRQQGCRDRQVRRGACRDAVARVRHAAATRSPASDSFFVQVSTDGGATYHSLANADTTCDLDPGASATLIGDCPGLNGDSGGWVTETFDLTPYAGQTILLALRYVTDANTRGAGVRADNVSVGGNVVSDGSSLAGRGRRSHRSSRSR